MMKNELKIERVFYFSFIDIQINNQTYKWNMYALSKNYNRNTVLEIRYIFLEAGM
jgi:hypothetical protein